MCGSFTDIRTGRPVQVRFMADYTTVTELPGHQASREQLLRMFQRYHLATRYSTGDSCILEAACGGGMGLGYLASHAKKVIGGDIDENNLQFARDHYKNRNNIEIKKLDAQELPFEDECFDVVLLYEAIYYLPQPSRFVQEARRVLKNGGTLIICSVNKDWTDFNPSPHSVGYYSAPELHAMVKTSFSDVKLYGSFETYAVTARDKVVSLIKRLVVSLHLMPKTMKGKAFLKRVFLGSLAPVPSEIEGGQDYSEPAGISPEVPCKDYKVLYVVAKKTL